MGEALRHGPTRAAMKVTMLTDESMELEVTSGMTVVSTAVIGVKTK